MHKKQGMNPGKCDYVAASVYTCWTCPPVFMALNPSFIISLIIIAAIYALNISGIPTRM